MPEQARDKLLLTRDGLLISMLQHSFFRGFNVEELSLEYIRIPTTSCAMIFVVPY